MLLVIGRWYEPNNKDCGGSGSMGGIGFRGLRTTALVSVVGAIFIVQGQASANAPVRKPAAQQSSSKSSYPAATRELKGRVEKESSRALNERACELLADKKYREALELLNQAYAIVRQNGNRTRAATIMENMAVAYRGLGRPDYERKCKLEAERLFAPPVSEIPINQYTPMQPYAFSQGSTQTVLFGSSSPDREWMWREHSQDRQNNFTRDFGTSINTNNYAQNANTEMLKHDMSMDSMQESQFASSHAQAAQSCNGTSHMSRYNNTFGR